MYGVPKLLSLDTYTDSVMLPKPQVNPSPFFKGAYARPEVDSSPFHNKKHSRAEVDSSPFHNKKHSRPEVDSSPFHNKKYSRPEMGSPPYHHNNYSRQHMNSTPSYHTQAELEHAHPTTQANQYFDNRTADTYDQNDNEEEEPFESRHRNQDRGSENSLGHLKHATEELNTRCTDPLSNVLVATSPTQRSVLAGLDSPRDSQRRDKHSKTGSLIGLRPTSAPVKFNSQADDDDELTEEEDEVPSLPKNAVEPIQPVTQINAATATAPTPRAVNTTSSPVRAKGRRRWSQDEENFIIQGISECGMGRWADIKRKYFSDSSRSQVDIKDKYRNMMKNN